MHFRNLSFKRLFFFYFCEDKAQKMKTNLEFRKNLLSNHYRIYRESQQIGFLKKNFLSGNVSAEINETQYFFSREDILSRNSRIINSEKKIIGLIKPDLWFPKANIYIGNRKFYWHYTNFWNTKFSLVSEDKSKIDFKSDGTVLINNWNNPELEILCGLYTEIFFNNKRLITLAIIFLPIYLVPLLSHFN